LIFVLRFSRKQFLNRKTFVIDSSDRQSGEANNFTLYLTPVLLDVRKVMLAFASIPMLAGSDNLYWCVSIPQLGLHARASNKTGSFCTFVVPVMSNVGKRTIFNSMSSYEAYADANGADINELSVRIHYPDGTLVDMGAEEIALILKIE
jgi:hypothetical protein